MRVLLDQFVEQSQCLAALRHIKYKRVELGLGSTSTLRRNFGALLKSMSTQRPVNNVLAQLDWCFAQSSGAHHWFAAYVSCSVCSVLPALGLPGSHRWVACSARCRRNQLLSARLQCALVQLARCSALSLSATHHWFAAYVSGLSLPGALHSGCLARIAGSRVFGLRPCCADVLVVCEVNKVIDVDGSRTT